MLHSWALVQAAAASDLPQRAVHNANTGSFMLAHLLSCPPAGGTILKVLEDIIARGGQPQNIIVISVVAAPPALQKLSKFSGTCIAWGSASIVTAVL